MKKPSHFSIIFFFAKEELDGQVTFVLSANGKIIQATEVNLNLH